MPEWVALELGVEHIEDERPHVPAINYRVRRIEQSIARNGGRLSAVMRETGCSYGAAWKTLHRMEAA